MIFVPAVWNTLVLSNNFPPSLPALDKSIFPALSIAFLHFPISGLRKNTERGKKNPASSDSKLSIILDDICEIPRVFIPFDHAKKKGKVNDFTHNFAGSTVSQTPQYQN